MTWAHNAKVPESKPGSAMFVLSQAWPVVCATQSIPHGSLSRWRSKCGPDEVFGTFDSIVLATKLFKPKTFQSIRT